MPKYFLLIAGHGYYPREGTRDWKKCYMTYEDAISHVKTKKSGKLVSYTIHNVKYDWFEIVDLRDYINAKD